MHGKYKQDYEYQDVTDENGKASSQLVYIGKYYQSDLSEAELASFQKEGLVSSFSSLLALILGGLLSSGAGRAFGVMIPWLIVFLCLIYFIRGSIQLARVPARMTRHQYEDSYGRTARSTLLGAFFSAVTAVADVIFLISSRERSQFPGDLLFLISILLVFCVTAVFFYRNRSRLNSAVPQ